MFLHIRGNTERGLISMDICPLPADLNVDSWADVNAFDFTCT